MHICAGKHFFALRKKTLFCVAQENIYLCKSLELELSADVAMEVVIFTRSGPPKAEWPRRGHESSWKWDFRELKTKYEIQVGTMGVVEGRAPRRICRVGQLARKAQWPDLGSEWGTPYLEMAYLILIFNLPWDGHLTFPYRTLTSKSSFKFKTK